MSKNEQARAARCLHAMGRLMETVDEIEREHDLTVAEMQFILADVTSIFAKYGYEGREKRPRVPKPKKTLPKKGGLDG